MLSQIYCHKIAEIFTSLPLIIQRTTPRKPKPLRTCGGYWTLRPAPRGSLSPEEAHQHRNPGPRRAGPTRPRPTSRPRVTLAHLHRPMAEPRRHQSRPFPRRSRRTSGWPPFTPRRSSPTSTSSSRSLTSLLLFYVSNEYPSFGLWGFDFLGGLFGCREFALSFPFSFLLN